MPFHVCILQSETTGRFYVGQTKDLPSRIAYRNSDYSLSLRNRGPWKLVYSESTESCTRPFHSPPRPRQYCTAECTVALI